MKRNRVILILLGLALLAEVIGCQKRKTPVKKEIKMQTTEQGPGSFGYDLNFLRSKGEMVVLKDPTGRAQVIVSPHFQGKVFTSTAEGLGGYSFGWINYKLLDLNKKQPHINAYGGEDRLWLGPEGGRFSIFFRAGKSQIFRNWFTPKIFDTAVWKLVKKSPTSVEVKKEGHLVNYFGAEFDFELDRTVSLFSQPEIEKSLHLKVPESVHVVGFESANKITNMGGTGWLPQSGTLCLWILGMYRPSPQVTVIIPFKKGDPKKLGRIVTTDYFGKVSSDRLKIGDGVLFFKADGKMRSKIGVPRRRAKNVAGSYDPLHHALTIIQFDVPEGDFVYLNQLWKLKDNPYDGDVVNAYNDGPLADGSQIGPFYELESTSPALFIPFGRSYTHRHRTFHFVGEESALDRIAKKVLGVRLEDVQKAFSETTQVAEE